MNETDEAEVGTCDLCGQELIRTADDCWHPYDVERACPPQPDDPKMSTPESFDAWQTFYASGLRPGRPGREHFLPVRVSPT
jgi:hypothetical protein